MVIKITFLRQLSMLLKVSILVVQASIDTSLQAIWPLKKRLHIKVWQWRPKVLRMIWMGVLLLGWLVMLYEDIPLP